ncbi:nitroreductase family protein [Clostridium tyrobutyricum]|uniref:nitroreductase family protein n=1 Tax=Clostridium tyrobutyricum TaxID=1519 RepID=UPI00189F893D|nr:nitroreductase family protein [Clostridium tyrobutyricum]
MNKNIFIQVNHDKCTQCGLCVGVCRGTLGMGKYGPLVVDDFCIACGHCVAVCPNGALDNSRAPLKNQVLLEKSLIPDVETTTQFLRARRSIRSYRKKRISHETIRKLLDIARFAPTACNSQGVSYHVVDDPDTLKNITAVIADWAEKSLKDGALKNSPWSKNTVNTIRQYKGNGKDTILRNAPCLIIALADKEMSSLGRDNTHFALTYAQLYASSLGLGTCWSGLFEYCAQSNYQPLLKLLKIPKSKNITGAIIAGYPLYIFRRLVDRNTLQISWQ